MSRTLNLQIFKNDHFVGSRSFSQEVIKIGKLRSSDLHLEDDTVARIIAEGTDNSQVWETLTYLSEEIGPRLTGSSQLERVLRGYGQPRVFPGGS